MSISTESFVDSGRWQARAFDGSWHRTQGGELAVVNPADGTSICTVAQANATDIRRAAAAAAKAQPGWAERAPGERAAVLNKAADLLERHAAELSGWIVCESGSILAKADIEIEHSAGFLRHAAAAALAPDGLLLGSADPDRQSHARRVAHGVVGVISPFNFPLVLSIRAIAAALATGNAVVHKPDPRTPVSGGILIARLFEDAGLPPGLLHVLPGDAQAGEAMCTDPDIAMISFTGSVHGGVRVGELAGRHLKKVQLELGGKNALIVLEDADLAVAASNAAWGCFLHQGQICMSTGLVLVQQRIADDLAGLLAAKAEGLPVGDPSNANVALGPIISDSQVERIQGIVDDAVAKGARLLAGGKSQGRFYAATVLAGVQPGMRAFEEEIFGPVACLTSFDTDDEAVALARLSEFGLAAGVLSASVGRAHALGRRLKVGHLHINDQTVNAGPFAPFGGRGRSGNGSRISGPALWEEFTQWAWTTVKEKATAYPF